MRHVRLGTTGLQVSLIAIGAMTYGEPDRGHPVWSKGEDTRMFAMPNSDYQAGLEFVAMTTRWSRSISFAATALVLVGAATACSSDDKKSTSTTVAATSPEEHQADDATVTAGLGRMVKTADTVAATVATGTKVTDAAEQLEADWSQVEGTVKTNEPDTYLAIEDAITSLDTAASDGDTATAAKAAASLSTAIAAYLAKHP